MTEQPPADRCSSVSVGAPLGVGSRRADEATNGSGKGEEQGPHVPTESKELLNGGDATASTSSCLGNSVDVYVGGLPEKVEDEALRTAFQAIGKVLEISVARREGGVCKGYAYVKLPDQETAEVACRMIRQIRTVPVGVHVKCGRQPGEPCASSHPLPQFPLDTEPKATINTLIRSLRTAKDKKAAVTAAFKAVRDGMRIADGTDQLQDINTEVERTPAPLLDMTTYLDSFTKCKRMMLNMKTSPGGDNKTPLAVLHEYATRWSLEVSHDEVSASNMGPFDVETKLTDVCGQIYATGAGRGKNKKDAKQISAAATLELLLETLSEDCFIQPGKARQRSVQAGRGRGRSTSGTSNGRGRGNIGFGSKWGVGYRSRNTRTTGVLSNVRGSRGGFESGQKRDYASMLGLSEQASMSNLQMQAPNLMGLLGGANALSPLMNQGVGVGPAGVGLPAMMTGVALGGTGAAGMQGGMNAIAGMTGNNMLGTMTMGNPQIGQQIGALGAASGSSMNPAVQVNGLTWANSLSGATGGGFGVNGGAPALSLGADGLVGIGGNTGLSAGQQTSMGLLSSTVATLSHIPMGQPNGTNLLGGVSLGQQTPTGQFNF